jgi:hypothetical protein
MQYVILQINTILTTTTTNLLQIIYDYNPPKIFPKFKNNFLSGIQSNTFGAENQMKPMLKIWVGPSPTLATPAALEHHLTLLHHFPSPANTGACSP